MSELTLTSRASGERTRIASALLAGLLAGLRRRFKVDGYDPAAGIASGQVDDCTARLLSLQVELYLLGDSCPPGEHHDLNILAGFLSKGSFTIAAADSAGIGRDNPSAARIV